jgi:hypothetical protein
MGNKITIILKSEVCIHIDKSTSWRTIRLALQYNKTKARNTTVAANTLDSTPLLTDLL